jgi:hypothetical protein
LLLVAVLALSVDAAAAPARLTVCVDRPRDDRDAARLLGRWLSSTRVVVVSRRRCRTAAGQYRGWFERREGRAELVLAGRSGAPSRRTIPWLRGRMCLSWLAERGQLARFAVVLQGLIIERELDWLLADPPKKSEKEPLQVEEVIRTARVKTASRSRKLRRQAPRLLAETLSSLASADRRARRTQPVRSASARPVEREAGLGFVDPPKETGRPERRDPAPRPTTPRPTTPPLPAERPSPRRATDEPGVASVGKGRGRKRTERLQTIRSRRAAAMIRTTKRSRSAPDVRKQPASSAARGLRLEGHLGGRFRSGGLLSLEVGGRLGWRGLFVGAGYQPGAEWDLEGRPVEVRAVPLAAGWRPVVWRRRSWELRAEVALLVEHMMLRRLDLEEAGGHGHWDVGVAGGTALAYRAPRGVGAGIGVALCWFPAAQEIDIKDGPAARLSDIGVKWAFFLEWRPAP